MTARFVQRVTTRRNELGISQSELARLMKQRGFPWHPMTISRTENGERPIRLDEAETLADILAMPLTTSDEAAATLNRAHQEITDLLRANTDLAHELSNTKDQLAQQTTARHRAEATLNAIKTALADRPKGAP